jgi:hypothetical protein
MPSIIILDTGPLSNAVVAPVKPNSEHSPSQLCRTWMLDCEGAGALLLVPAICYYEVLRELERRHAAVQIARLRAFVFGTPDRFIPLATEHLEAAARLWGAARNEGAPGASCEALDADVMLCAQSLALGLPPSAYVVATTNVGHLSRFVPCAEWTNIKP